MPVALERFANDFATTLSAGALSGDATITVAAAAPASLQGAGQFRVKVDDEIMVVTSGAATTTWTVTRGEEGTTAAAHSSGVAVTHVLTQGALERWVPEYVWQPQHLSLLAWTYDPMLLSGTGSTLTATGQVSVVMMRIPETITVASMVTEISSAGATLTAGRNLGLLYAYDGTLIARTADQSTTWTSTGIKTMALTAESGQSLTITGGPGVFVYAGFLSRGSTVPAVRRQAYAAQMPGNGTLTSGFRTALTVASGLTSPPNPLGALSLNFAYYWVGLA